MDESLAAMYGPLATEAPYQPGASIIYSDQAGAVENGKVLWVARQDDSTLLYVVSPAIAAFPTPIWPEQIIAAMWSEAGK